MSSTDVMPVCPQCGGQQSVALSAGVHMCLVGDCRHEWNPADVPAFDGTRAPVAAVVTELRRREWQHPAGAGRERDPADDVLGPPASELAARDAQAALDALVDTDVILDGGQVATIVSFPDDDHVTVLLRYDDDHDELATVAFGDVVRAKTPAPVALDVSDADAYKLAAVNMLVAGLAIRAALAMLAGDAPDYTLRTPPAGWLPDDASSLPIVEQGVAYAIASLVVAYGLPRDTLTAVADQFVTDSQDPTTKGE